MRISLANVIQHRVSVNTGALMLLQLITYAVPILVLIRLADVLGIQIYGLIAYVTGIVQFTSVFLDFGFTLSATQKIAQWREAKLKVGRLIGAIFLIKSILLLVASSFFVLYALTTKKYEEYHLVFIAAIIPLTGICYQVTWFFAGIEKMKNIVLFIGASRLLYLVLVYAVIDGFEDYLLVILLDGFTQILAAIFSIFLMYRSGVSVATPRFKQVFALLRFSSGYFGSRISASVYLTGGTVFLGLWGTPFMVGIYAISERCYLAMQNVISPLVQATFPYMAKERNLPLMLKIIVLSIAVSICGSIFGYLAAPWAVSFLVSEHRSEIVSVVNIFLVTFVVHVAAVMSGYPLAAVLRNTRFANVSVAFGAVTYAIGTLVLILLGHVTAASFALLVLLAECTVFVSRFSVFYPQSLRMLAKVH